MAAAVSLIAALLAFLGSPGRIVGQEKSPPAPAPVDFARDVRPILQRNCVKCHGEDERSGGLRLDVRADALRGGDSGPVIVAGKSVASRLIQRISSKDADERMPPEGAPLAAEQVAILRAWIDQGAKWPADDPVADSAKRLEHWSFRPIRRPSLPAVRAAGWCRTPIDRFILAKLDALRLRPTGQADRRTLIRRLSFDLLGLPPEPARVEAFVRDTDPLAYEKLVDELLASPHYGERWARHWLDVVHFGETHGYDKDQPRPNAWPYRDYVIRALNDDKPYGRFIQEQIAGDALFPGTLDGIEGLGFIAAGPWDLIGHAEVPETKIDGMIARHLDRDDMVGNTLGTFCSLTVQCAQCHNHKFDPITQEDYYRLQAVFAAVDRADKRYDLDSAIAQRRGELLARQKDLSAKQTELDQLLVKVGGRRLEVLDRVLAEAKQAAAQSAPLPARVEFGWHSGIEAKQDTVKWVQVDLGASQKIARIVYTGCHDDFAGIGAGFGFPRRFRVEISDDPTFAAGVTVVEDQTKADVANPGVTPRQVAVGDRAARYVRIAATKLATRQNDYIFALAELQVLDAAGRNLALGAAVTSLDSIEAAPRWGRANLTDGYYYGRIAKHTPEQIAEMEKERAAILARATDPSLRGRRAAVARDLAAVAADLGRLPPQHVVYAGTVHNGSGTFRGTGPDGGRPRTVRVLARGDVKRPGKEAPPGAVTLLTLSAGLTDFNLPPSHAEGDRRAALARWITDPKNPLTWRSIVNRVWQYHFGRAIVDSPNDFGHMGRQPSHPELLDWLAADFRDHGQSLKQLHRLMVTSAVYRQRVDEGRHVDESLRDSKARLGETRPREKQAASLGETRPREEIQLREQLDADNVYLSHMNRRKLDAESVRDAVLLVAGQLDARMGGPSFQDFVIEHPEHSPHYEYQKYDPADARAYRRSIYRFLVRSQPQPFMTTLDCADPSMRVDKRNESLSPAQALAMLNDGLMLAMSKRFAERLSATTTLPASGGHIPASGGRQPPDGATLGATLSARIAAAYRLALARDPSANERSALTELARTHGLANACRVIFNLNEFMFVD